MTAAVFEALKWLAPEQMMRGAWIAFAAYWLISAIGRCRAQKREARGDRLVHILWLAAAAYLFYYSEPWMGPLDRRFIPDLPWIADLSAALTVLGIGFAIWARYHLGKNWSAEITIRADHQLIRTGPYAWLRHPIYTGLLVALLGTALWVGRYRALIALGMFLIGFSRKAKKEETFLAQEFGPKFEEHKRLTGFFLPRLG